MDFSKLASDPDLVNQMQGQMAMQEQMKKLLAKRFDIPMVGDVVTDDKGNSYVILTGLDNTEGFYLAAPQPPDPSKRSFLSPKVMYDPKAADFTKKVMTDPQWMLEQINALMGEVMSDPNMLSTLLASMGKNQG